MIKNISDVYRFVLRSRIPIRFFLLISFFLTFFNSLLFGLLRRIPLIKEGVDSLYKIDSAISSMEGLGPKLPKSRKDSKYYKKGIEIDEIERLIVGSGPGGAVAALQAIEEGVSFIVVDKGIESRTEVRDFQTIKHVFHDFESAGQEICVSNPKVVFSQGSVVGGGSEVNSGLYHDLPNPILETWTDQHKFLTQEEYRLSESETREFLKVKRPGRVNQFSPIKEGAQVLGWPFEEVRRWRHYEKNTFLHLGLESLLWRKNTEKVYPDLSLVKLKESNDGHITALFIDTKSKTHTIRAKEVVLSAGNIGTPLILMRSKIIPSHEFKFSFHPMVRLLARYDFLDSEILDVDDFQCWNSDKSLKFGGGVSNRSMLSFNEMRNLNPEEAKRIRSLYASFIPTGTGGFLPMGKQPYFRFSKTDFEMLSKAYDALNKIAEASRASSILTSKRQALSSLSTVHIFGSLPIGHKQYQEGTTRLKRFPQIQVLDGSILPSATSVNPQGPIMSLCKVMGRKNRAFSAY